MAVFRDLGPFLGLAYGSLGPAEVSFLLCLRIVSLAHLAKGC